MIRRTWTVPEGCSHVAGRDDLSATQLGILETLAYREGEAYDSYLALERGLEYFFDGGSQGAVGFTRWRDHLFVVGGLLAAESRRPRLLRQFMQFAEANGCEISFLNVLGRDVPAFRAAGFSVSKVGEEPVVPLADCTWKGADFAWVRRQENFCVRSGVRFEEVIPDADCPVYRNQVAPELLEVSSEHLSDTVYGRELSMMVGRLDPLKMFRKRLFVARKNGRIEAFVIANPGRNGDLWSVETYRKRTDATRGVIAFLIAQIARQLRSEDVTLLSLCQVPTLRVKQGTRSDSGFVTSGLHFWWKCLPWFYDPPRQYHFKSRFRPQYRECFVATYPKTRVLPMLAFFFKWGVIVPDLKRLPMQMLRRMSKWKNREKLADPAAEPYLFYEPSVAEPTPTFVDEPVTLPLAPVPAPSVAAFAPAAVLSR
jgi:phosphatidylglycerol lysyltransferase